MDMNSFTIGEDLPVKADAWDGNLESDNDDSKMCVTGGSTANPNGISVKQLREKYENDHDIVFSPVNEYLYRRI